MHLPPQCGVEPLTRTQACFHVGRQAIPLSPSGPETLLVLPVPVPCCLAVLIIQGRVTLAIPLVVMLTARALPTVLR